MSKTIDILDVVKWLDDNFIPTNTGMSEMMLRSWLKSKLWEPTVGEICEFSNFPDFPDSDTSVGYYLGTDNGLFRTSIYKSARTYALYEYIRPIKGGGE